MKTIHSHFYLLLFFLLTFSISHAQTIGITSGAVYSIKANVNNKLLNVTNSSTDVSANVDCWTNTNSDAQRWTVTLVSDSTYTLINAGSGEYLHIASTPANLVNVDIYPNSTNIKWIISPVGDGSFYLKAAANRNFMLNVNAGGTIDGTNVNVSQYSPNTQKWTFNLETPQDAPPSLVIADNMFAVWRNKYNIDDISGFWQTAEMMEIVVDAYEVTGNSKYKTMFNTMYNNFLVNNGTNWVSWNKYNDDIAWIVIACTRASFIFGDSYGPIYLAKAKDQFDKMYTRANTPLYGGGLNWLEGNASLSKNACINGPAMVACCYLAQATGDNSYYDKAIGIYNWSKIYLFNNTTGKIIDKISTNTATGALESNTWSSTYNQGTYMGAAVMLYNYTKDATYLQDAESISQYTVNNMFTNKVINKEDGSTDLEGFKGILMRYARRYTVDGYKTNLIPWLILNAKIAYNNRNSSNLTNTLWGTKTVEDYDATLTHSFGSSTIVSLLINCPLSTTLKKNAFGTIQAENFDYLKGVTVEACPEGTSNLTDISNDFYTGYFNIDFGLNGADSAKFRISSTSSTGTIEVHLESPSGSLLGTATISSTGDFSLYKTITCPIAVTKGLQNIYLVYKGTGTICKLNYFSFIEDINSAVNLISENKLIEIYPNPVVNQLNVNCYEHSIKSIKIGDLNGRILNQNTENKGNITTMDVSNLSKGVYLIIVTTDLNEKIVHKFIK